MAASQRRRLPSVDGFDGWCPGAPVSGLPTVVSMISRPVLCCLGSVEAQAYCAAPDRTNKVAVFVDQSAAVFDGDFVCVHDWLDFISCLPTLYKSPPPPNSCPCCRERTMFRTTVAVLVVLFFSLSPVFFFVFHACLCLVELVVVLTGVVNARQVLGGYGSAGSHASKLQQ